LPSRVACKWGEDEIRKLIINYKEGMIKNALRREQAIEWILKF
jgi:hypothetical protein